MKLSTKSAKKEDMKSAKSASSKIKVEAAKSALMTKMPKSTKSAKSYKSPTALTTKSDLMYSKDGGMSLEGSHADNTSRIMKKSFSTKGSEAKLIDKIKSIKKNKAYNGK